MEQYMEQIKLCKALEILDKELDELDIKPIELNVCGGFAMLLQQVRLNGSIYTDIDYIGKDLPPNVCSLTERVGTKLGYGKDWINNDILLTGTTLEDIEYATGELHFERKLTLKNIKVNALCKKDLLRMKIIAVDTSFIGMQFGGTLTRSKDFEDIRLLAKDLNMTVKDIKNECGDYILEPKVFNMIDHYFKTKDKLFCTGKSYDDIVNLLNSLKGEEQYATR